MLLFKYFPGYDSNRMDDALASWLNNSSTYVVRLQRAFADARASNMRRFCNAHGGAPVDVQWDAWLDARVRADVRLQSEALWADRTTNAMAVQSIWMAVGLSNRSIDWAPLDREHERQHNRTHTSAQCASHRDSRRGQP